MSLDELKQEVWRANVEIGARGLAPMTWGNASGVDRERGLVVIKPSGVPYDGLAPSDLAVVTLTGEAVEGLKPSSDTPTHLVLYNAWPEIGGIVHTHSRYATAWAQARRAIPCLGTTHADYFRGPVPVTDDLEEDDIRDDYEENTGRLIVRRFALDDDPLEIPAVLLAGHAPFCWGPTVALALETATVLEEIARMAAITVSLSNSSQAIPDALRDKHFLRKHGPGRYYGQ